MANYVEYLVSFEEGEEQLAEIRDRLEALEARGPERSLKGLCEEFGCDLFSERKYGEDSNWRFSDLADNPDPGEYGEINLVIRATQDIGSEYDEENIPFFAEDMLADYDEVIPDYRPIKGGYDFLVSIEGDEDQLAELRDRLEELQEERGNSLASLCEAIECSGYNENKYGEDSSWRFSDHDDYPDPGENGELNLIVHAMSDISAWGEPGYPFFGDRLMADLEDLCAGFFDISDVKSDVVAIDIKDLKKDRCF